MLSSHAPVRGFATVNTIQRDRHQYVTNLDVVVDKVALENRELSHRETLQLVDYLTVMTYGGGRVDALRS